jgi:hypothetical protein
MQSSWQYLTRTIWIGSATVDAVIVAVPDSDHLHRMVMTQKTSAVLAELIIDSAAVADHNQLSQAVSDLCLVLSVMRGTKVQWIYRQDWHERQVIKTIHRAGLTKAYSPLAPLGYEYESASDCERFVKVGVAALSTSPILQADRTVIDAYLDAKVEHDFLETRAAKVALALEKLKQVCLQTGAMAVGEFEADEAVFRSVVPAMVSAALPLAISGGIPAGCRQAHRLRVESGWAESNVISPGRQGALVADCAERAYGRTGPVHRVPQLLGARGAFLL